MEKTKSKKTLYNLIIFVCVSLYVSMMILKNTFLAEIISIIDFFGSTKSQISIANTYYYVIYALVQAVLAFVMNKINPKFYLFITVPFSIVVYVLLVSVLSEVKQIWYLFALNGFAQAGIVAITKLFMAKFLPFDYLTKGNKLYSIGQPVAIILAYGFSSVCVKFFSWRIPFIVFSALFLAILVLFGIVITVAEKTLPVVDVKGKDVNDEDGECFVKLPTKKSKAIYIVVSMPFYLFTNCVIYAISNWLTVYFNEIFGMEESYSILITLLLSVFGCVGTIVGISITQKKRDYLDKSVLFYTLTLLILFCVIFLYKTNIILSIIMFISFEMFYYIALGCTTNIIFDMRKEINAGTFSAISNAMASISAGVMPTVIASVIENLGWRADFIIVGAFCLVTIAILVFANVIVKKQNAIRNNK